MTNLLQPVVRLPRTLLELFVARAVRLLTDPVKQYQPSEATNVHALKKRARVGDVFLVSGDARISYVVKVLTVSQWSHIVLYVGDRRDLLTEEEKEDWVAKYGYSALEHLVVDADPVRGVHLKPLDQSVGLMVRHCRPTALNQEDLNAVVEHTLSQLGLRYDIKHILNLLFFFAFPWEYLPEGLRRIVTDFTLSESDRICSRVLAEAFHKVGYPIRPTEILHLRGKLQTKAVNFATGLKYRGRSAARLLAGGRVRAAVSRISDKRYVELHLRQTRHITPADYDLSRFFSIIKDDDDLSIDYRSARTLRPGPYCQL